jgi:GNAT superfamily N-acetyltransferase
MISVRPLTSTTWKDFSSLMESNSQCKECWCLNHRASPGCPTGALAEDQMRMLVASNEVYGLLAYRENACVGWIAVDPMTELKGHDCQATGKSGEWSIHCLFVKEGHRGQGISGQLIQAAVKYAKENGAKLISAFPIPLENRDQFPEHEAEFSGRLSTYSKLGFGPVGDPTEFYQRMELE